MFSDCIFITVQSLPCSSSSEKTLFICISICARWFLASRASSNRRASPSLTLLKNSIFSLVLSDSVTIRSLCLLPPSSSSFFTLVSSSATLLLRLTLSLFNVISFCVASLAEASSSLTLALYLEIGTQLAWSSLAWMMLLCSCSYISWECDSLTSAISSFSVSISLLYLLISEV